MRRKPLVTIYSPLGPLKAPSTSPGDRSHSLGPCSTVRGSFPGNLATSQKMKTALIILAVVTFSLVISAVDCGGEEHRKKSEKLKQCLEGSDVEAKKGRIIKAIKSCKEGGKSKEEFKTCFIEKLELSEDEKKCIAAEHA
ncbi:uncharacterized protein [Dermacentor albipictus]|uniref:uncharacterized protein n=1 Tax=Dermacentor albipictus TaxID=60249 RepID=UPI0031FDC9D6